MVVSKRNPHQGQSFTQRDIAPSIDFRGVNYQPNTMVTKAGKERLEALRSKPNPQQQLRPKMVDHARIDNGLDRLRERQLRHHTLRLGMADYEFNRDRLKAVHNGYAKAGFNKANEQNRASTPSHVTRRRGDSGHSR